MEDDNQFQENLLDDKAIASGSGPTSSNDGEWSFVGKVGALIGIFIGCALLGSFLLIVCMLMGGADLTSGFDIFGSMDDPTMRPFAKAGIGFNHLSMFALTAIIFAFAIKGAEWKSYFSFNDVDAALVWKFVLLLVLAYPLIGISAMAFEHIDLPEWMDSLDEQSIDSLMSILSMNSVADLLINLLIIAVLPAIGEELLFRGVIQRELVKVMDNPHIAILLASIIFSAVHMQIQGFLPKLIIGLILGYAYYWTKSLWIPMLLHFINNSVPTFMLYWAGDDIEGLEAQAQSPQLIPMIALVAISCFLCYLMVNNIKTQVDQSSPQV